MEDSKGGMPAGNSGGYQRAKNTDLELGAGTKMRELDLTFPCINSTKNYKEDKITQDMSMYNTEENTELHSWEFLKWFQGNN